MTKPTKWPRSRVEPDTDDLAYQMGEIMRERRALRRLAAGRESYQNVIRGWSIAFALSAILIGLSLTMLWVDLGGLRR